MEKAKLISEIKNYLVGEKNEAIQAQDAEKADELERLILMYRFLPVRTYTHEDVIIPSALVELKFRESSAYYFVAPQGGGLVTRVEGRAVQVITPQSPLGEALLGKKVGDVIQVKLRSGSREYTVVSIC